MVRATTLVLTLLATTAAFAEPEKPSPFAEPSSEYMAQFAKPHAKTFVYERFDANGNLADRTVDTLSGPVEIVNSTERKFNGFPVKLRGLIGCVSPKVRYEGQEASCEDSAKDYAGAVYNNRATVILCKTLVLKTDPRYPDPVSCYQRVGDGSSLNPFIVVSDDDAMVFQGMAMIGKSKDGKLLRPDLEKSAELGSAFMNAPIEPPAVEDDATEAVPAEGAPNAQ